MNATEHGLPAYMPTPVEIRRACLEIQATWSPQERYARATTTTCRCATRTGESSGTTAQSSSCRELNSWAPRSLGGPVADLS